MSKWKARDSWGGPKLAEALLVPRASVSQSPSPRRSRYHPEGLTVVARRAEIAQALEAYCCDAGISSRRLATAALDDLLALKTPAAVIFVDDFLLRDLLPTLSSLHSRRPDLALVLVAGNAWRFALWRAFEGSTLPPLVLRDSAPAPVIYDAVRVASDACAAEQLESELDSSGSAGALAEPVAEVVRMLTTDGPLCDHIFDRLLPIRLRAASNQFWTPLDVVKRAVQWFGELGVRSVVDIGSGVGKFCVSGALTSSCSFIGIEQRPQLVAVARNLSRMFAVDGRVSIIHGRFGEIETPAADCYYLYNPFEENLFPPRETLDFDVELSAPRFRDDVRSFRRHVAALPLGAYVLSYNGIGARMPDCLDEVRVDRELPAVLRLLQKERS